MAANEHVDYDVPGTLLPGRVVDLTHCIQKRVAGAKPIDDPRPNTYPQEPILLYPATAASMCCLHGTGERLGCHRRFTTNVRRSSSYDTRYFKHFSFHRYHPNFPTYIFPLNVSTRSSHSTKLGEHSCYQHNPISNFGR
ncbi:unnamed protein product [Ectocarpus fasciculatus]